MSTRISDMKNLGPATERMLTEVDIQSAEHLLRSLGAVEAYHRLKFRFGQHVTLIALYAMEAAIRNCDCEHWIPEPKDTRANRRT